MTQTFSSLRELFDHFWGLGNFSVVVNATFPGVDLPSNLMEFERLILDFGPNLGIPINDLTMDDDGVRATLSFSRQPFTVYLPWQSFMGMSNDDIMWVADEAMMTVEKVEEPQVPEPTPDDSQKPAWPPFSVIQGGKN